jgi:hypothetical protein
MITYIPLENSKYPPRLNANKLFNTEYKDKRHIIFLKPIGDYNDVLVPKLKDYKDKLSFITNDYLLNSINFEYCDYYLPNDINYDNICSTFLPINPYGPTGIGGLGLLKKWGPNHMVISIIMTHDNEKNISQILVLKNSEDQYLPTDFIDNENQFIPDSIKNELKDETNIILNLYNTELLYSGYQNDSKNTDHAWIENKVYLFNLDTFKRNILLNIIKNNKNLVLIDIPDNINFTKIKNIEFLNYLFK